MPTEIPQPAYVNPSGGDGAGVVAVEVANQAARLALTGSDTRKAVAQLDDDTVWALTAGGSPSSSADWRLIGRRSVRFLGTAASQAAMLAFATARTGDWCHRSDVNLRFDFTGANPATAAHWTPALGMAIADIDGLSPALAALDEAVVDLEAGVAGKVPKPIGDEEEPSQGVAGTKQREKFTLTGSAVSDGNVKLTVSGAGFASVVVTVPILAGDSNLTWGSKVRDAANADNAFNDLFLASRSGSTFRVEKLVEALDDPTFNVAIANDPAANPGITEVPVSTDDVAGSLGAAGTAGELGQEYHWGTRTWVCVNTSPMTWVERPAVATVLTVGGQNKDMLGADSRYYGRRGLSLTGSDEDLGDYDRRCDIAVSGIGGSYASTLNATWIPAASGLTNPGWRLPNPYLDGTWSIYKNVGGFWTIGAWGAAQFVGQTPDLDFPWLEASWALAVGSVSTGSPLLIPKGLLNDDRILREYLPDELVAELVDAATIAWNVKKGRMATLTLGGNRTLANPTNVTAGTYIVRVKQDGTGGRTLAFGSNFSFVGGPVPVLTSTPGATDILTFVNFGDDNLLHLVPSLNSSVPAP